jgi:hypothetical protein
MLIASRILVGLLLLLFGRRLYWLFVAAIGFMTGLELGPRLLPEQSDLVIIVVALGLALVGALLAVVATKLFVGIVGFAAGGAIAALLLPNLGIEREVLGLLVYVVAGIIGALLLLVVFDWALVLLSSLAGATLIVVTLERLFAVPPPFGTALIVGLTVVGAVVQFQMVGLPRRPPAR